MNNLAVKLEKGSKNRAFFYSLIFNRNNKRLSFVLRLSIAAVIINKKSVNIYSIGVISSLNLCSIYFFANLFAEWHVRMKTVFLHYLVPLAGGFRGWNKKVYVFSPSGLRPPPSREDKSNVFAPYCPLGRGSKPQKDLFII